MTLQEAIKSGRDFKRISDRDWIKNTRRLTHTFTEIDFLEDIWEVKPGKIIQMYYGYSSKNKSIRVLLPDPDLEQFMYNPKFDQEDSSLNYIRLERDPELDQRVKI
jgi:hypothetical protein